MKLFIHRALKLFGLKVCRIVRSEDLGNSNGYYEFPVDCQIPYLSYIYELFFNTRIGYLVEIGAYDGISYSNSSGLIEKGWGAILVEPIPEFAERVRLRYRNNENVSILEKAVSEKEEQIEFQIAEALTSANPKLFEEYSKITWSSANVEGQATKFSQKAVTLAEILNDVATQHTDLLIVDVEGFEEKVFSTFHLVNSLPSMIIVEMTEFHPDFFFSAYSYVQLRERLEKFNYKVIFKDSINTIFIRDSLYLEKLSK